MRIYVEPQVGWTSREIGARLTIYNDGEAPVVVGETMTVTESSTQADIDSTFNFYVDAETPINGPLDTFMFRATTRYSVELRELMPCASLEGTATGARFPETGEADLNAQQTGVIKVTYVPIISSASTQSGMPPPATDAAAIKVFDEAVYRTYPTTGVVSSVRAPMNTAWDIGQGFATWDAVLNELRNLKDADNAPADMHYYGMMNPNGATGAGGLAGSGFCAFDECAGSGVGRAAPDPTRYEGDAGIYAHELGHMHGQAHVNGGCGSSGGDPGYPHANGSIGVWGYDLLKDRFYDPATHKDMMTYCNPSWVSDYNFNIFAERIAHNLSLTGPFVLEGGDTKVGLFQLLVSAEGATWWGIPTRRAYNIGKPESAVVLKTDGTMLNITVWRDELSHGGAIVDVPEPEAGWEYLQLDSAASIRFDEPRKLPPVQ
jgi:hypothetical protein